MGSEKQNHLNYVVLDDMMHHYQEKKKKRENKIGLMESSFHKDSMKAGEKIPVSIRKGIGNVFIV